MFILEDLRRAKKSYDKRIWINKSNNLIKLLLLKIIGLSLLFSFIFDQINSVDERTVFLIHMGFAFLAFCLLYSFLKQCFYRERLILNTDHFKRILYWGKWKLEEELIACHDIHHMQIHINKTYNVGLFHHVVLQHNKGNFYVGGHFSWQDADHLLQLLQQK